MKKIILKSACLLFIILFVTGQLLSQTDSELKRKIEQINKEMASAMLADNTEKIMSYYADDVVSLPSYEPMLKGKDAIRKSSDDMKKSGMKIKSFESTTQEVRSAGNMVIEIGTYKIGMMMPGKTEPMNDNGKYLTIWEKQKDGSLKIKIETWNTDVNYMQQMEKEHKHDNM